MSGYIVNDTDTTSPISFGVCETACGIAAELHRRESFQAWADVHTDTFNGWSGILWACIELARHAEAHVEAHGGWDEFGIDFYEAIERIAAAMLACEPAGDTEAMKAAVSAALDVTPAAISALDATAKTTVPFLYELDAPRADGGEAHHAMAFCSTVCRDTFPREVGTTYEAVDQPNADELDDEHVCDNCGKPLREVTR